MNIWLLVKFILGFSLGLIILILDNLFGFKYYEDNQELARYQTGVKQLITRSIIFLVPLLPVSFFIISSSGSFLGSGLVLGLLLGTSLELVLALRKKQIINKFFWQTKINLTNNQQLVFVIIFVSFSILLALLFFL